MNDNFQEVPPAEMGPGDDAALKEALNESSNRNRTLFITFLIVQVYFLLAIVGTSDLNLLLPESEFQLPIINIVVPIFAFYICAPVLLLAFHLNLLIQLLEHCRKLYRWVDGKSHNRKLTLHPFLINSLVSHKAGEINYFILRFITSMLYVVLPLFLFCALQFRFSDYHSPATTLWHFAFVIADIFIVGIYWTRISNPELLADEFNAWKALKHAPAFQSQTFVILYRCVALAPWVLATGVLFYYLAKLTGLTGEIWLLIFTLIVVASITFLQESFIGCWPHIGLNRSFWRNQKIVAKTIFKPRAFDKNGLLIILLFQFFILILFAIVLRSAGPMLIILSPFFFIAAAAGARFIIHHAQKGKKYSRIIIQVVLLNLFIFLWPLWKLLGSVIGSIRANNDQFWTNMIALAAIFNLAALFVVIHADPAVPSGVGHSLSLHSNVNMFLPHLNLSEVHIADASQGDRPALFPPDAGGSPYDQWLRGFKAINLRGRDLKRAVFTKAGLYNVDLRDADLLGADFRHAGVYGGDWSQARLARVDFSDGHLRGVDMFNVNFSKAKLADTQWIEVNLRSAGLSRASLQSAVIQGCNMGSVHLQNASLPHAALYGVDLNNAYLDGASFKRAKCYGVNFFSARKLAQADLTEADLKGCRFSSFDQIQNHLSSLHVSGSLVDTLPKEAAAQIDPSIRKNLIFWRTGEAIEPFWYERRAMACEFPRSRKGLIAQNRSFQLFYSELLDAELEQYLSLHCNDKGNGE